MPTFDRTRAALVALDAARAAFGAAPSIEALDAEDAALAALGEAFAADTPQNDPAEARHVVTYPAGLAWLRRLVCELRTGDTEAQQQLELTR